MKIKDAARKLKRKKEKTYPEREKKKIKIEQGNKRGELPKNTEILEI